MLSKLKHNNLKRKSYSFPYVHFTCHKGNTGCKKRGYGEYVLWLWKKLPKVKNVMMSLGVLDLSVFYKLGS